MTARQPGRQGTPRRGPAEQVRLHVGPQPPAPEEPAYREDPLMGWSSDPEPPPELRLGTRPWPPPAAPSPGRRPPL